MRNLLILLLSIGLLGACSTKDNTINFTFIQLNDVYEIAPLEGGKVGGMARVEQLHKDLLKENPNTYLFLAGDYLNPSLLGTLKYKGERIKGKQMVEVMNAMNFDLVALGNHEFDLKENELQQRLNESKFQIIATNPMHKTAEGIQRFTSEKNGVKTELPKTVNFDVKNAEGTSIKIGFFSACLNSNPKSYVHYEDFYESAKFANNKLEKECDVVFGLTHLTIDQDKMIANMFPNVPLIMGGHEHVNMSVPVGKSKITKADANAKTVYVHRISFNKKTKETTINSELVSITPETGSDKNVASIVSKWNVLLDEKIKEILPNPDEVIFTATEPLDGRDTPIRSTQTNLGLLVTTAMAHSFDTKIDCALVNGGSIRIDDQLQGDITGIDIFRVLPFGGEILKVEIKGDLLRKVLNYGRLKAGKGAYLQRYNAAYNKETKIWTVNNSKIIDTKVYTVAFSDYLLKGYDIPFLTPNNKGVIKVHKNKETAKAHDIRKAIIVHLQNL
ncbi:2',3'-cyclic-nucleotide 2'-phosphodiesterase/5'-or 3'-nucleotidase, 5'-nucleotidase family [Lutibacter oricola]|uniref:2',3'-cyclic-nucleotide 2'-phosphodiesterase/5'-or 3'-nucleotidase, 5'-nucleotidase family n=1 Tax=Lutibacter oricola TaxID=762486 RepID=A0A1H2X3A0_9FLAO|nr:bifunctional metallophosphatase/5'-nucleotidase [Lutibacter oricola]SDW87258.1 2',3'-cyclic-nucleotide 2'-phosphodiesterase/5'-or 3'-nucleotidase, 5'-nucleotidase family [Lutibacter oricola]